MTHTSKVTVNESDVKDNSNDAKKDHGAAPKKLNGEDNVEIKGSSNGRRMKQPMDHGYAWVILIGGIFQMALIIGLLKSSGLIFVAFQEKFKSSSSMTSLPSTIQNIVFSIMAVFVLNIGMKITSARILVFIGSILMCITFIVTSLAQDVRVLLFSHGVLHGMGSAFVLPTTVVTISQYFDKRRGFANSLAVSGSCVGGLVYAPLITNLLSSYGYEGCFLIVAGVLLNGCICGSLFRPLSFYTNMQSKTTNSQHDDVSPETQTLIPEETENCIVSNAVELGQNNRDKTIIGRFELDKKLISSTRSLNNKMVSDFGEMTRPRASTFVNHRDKTIPNMARHERHGHYSSKDFMSSSIFDIPAFIVPSTKVQEDLNRCNNHVDIENSTESGDRKVGNDKSWFRTFVSLFDYQVFKEPVFVAFLTSASCTCPSTIMSTIYIAPYAKDLGVSTESVAELLLVFTAVDLVARVTLGYISDKGWARRSTLVGFTTLIVSLSSHLLRFYTSYNSLIVFAVILGLVSGLYFSVYPVVITDYLSISRLQSCLGFTALVHGFTIAGTFFLVGYLRDVSGSYVVPYHFIGTQALIGATIMLSLPFVEKYHESRHEQTTKRHAP